MRTWTRLAVPPPKRAKSRGQIDASSQHRAGGRRPNMSTVRVVRQRVRATHRRRGAVMEILDLRFLVVEDHGFQRWMVANLLEGLGAQYVFSAADGRDALDVLEGREPPIDVIVTDLDMPGMDGMAFIRHVAEAKYPAALIVASSMEPSLIG